MSFFFVKVNYASMLEKCLVGRLTTKHNQKESSAIKTRSLPTRLRFDFRQPDSKSLTLFVYTTCITLTVEQIFVAIENSKKIHILVFIDGFVHTIAIGKYERNVNDMMRRFASFI
jgi:hypothetical protein